MTDEQDTEREKLVAELDRLGAKLRSARHECSRIGDKWDRAEDALRDYDRTHKETPDAD